MKLTAVVTILLTLGLNAQAYNPFPRPEDQLDTAQVVDTNLKTMAGCYDCYNFAAPTVAIAENISAPEVGLIVYDTNVNKFKGYTNGSVWSRLSAEKVSSVYSASSSSSGTTASVNDDNYFIDATYGCSSSSPSYTYTVTLPLASELPGKEIFIKKTDATFCSVRIIPNPSGSDTIDGGSVAYLKTRNESIRIVSVKVGNTSYWYIINRTIPSEWVGYTPSAVQPNTTTTPSTNFTGTSTARWRRVGDSIEIWYEFVTTTADSSLGTAVQFFIPTGLSVDTSKLNYNINSSTYIGGYGLGTAWTYGVESASGSVVANTAFHNINANSFGIMDVGGGGSKYGVSDFRLNSQVEMNIRLPISGWVGQ